MKPLRRLVTFSFDHPRLVLALCLLVTLVAGFAAIRIRIDTDPENMLEPGQPDRVAYDRMKRDFGLHDLIVVGIEDPRGMFRTEALEGVARAIHDIEDIPGVIREDVVSLTTTDNARAFAGLVDIRPVMEEVPQDSASLTRLREDIAENPFLRDKIASADGKAVAIYVPIRAKDQSYRIAGAIESILARELPPGQRHYLGGLPIAEDTFGHEMFVQMALVAPLAFLGILVLVFLLFGEPSFLLPVAIIALLSVVWSMGALIGTGNTVHIMSSMIPIFLMPIAILDSIHILSEFHERYRATGERREALLQAMEGLYRAMLFTSVTTAVGFLSLALAPIPPVQVFGLFVALGVVIAWALTHTLLPSLFALLGVRSVPGGAGRPRGLYLDPALGWIGRAAFRGARLVVTAAVVLLLLGVAGIQRLRSDDNPVRWFRPGHPMRVADDALNRDFGGTYMAHLILTGDGPDAAHRPEAVAFIDRVQRRLARDPDVGKTSSVADIVRRLNQVVHDGDPAYDRVPSSQEAIGQLLFLFQGSGDPNDLDNFVDPEGRRANIWVQMRSGDNHVMARVESELAQYLRTDPPPDGATVRWSGLNHINRVWQGLMVSGMLRAVLGSFLVVFLLMALEFRSLWLGLLSMLPLTVAIVLSYGLIGLSGKRYDMPIAVCSALSLGLAVDFAIHFLERYRFHFGRTRDREAANAAVFGAPARAITRNAIVISLGFLPLLFSTLTPYVTVSLFFASLMLASALATLFLLPAVMRFVAPRVFP
jgi:predicted RND superfamily exporter protein